MKRNVVSQLLFGLIILTPLFAGITGKVAGKVTEATSGDPLIGANVNITSTYLGGATDVNGHYTILNIPPGTYDLNVTMIGYRPVVIKEVRVEIDLTTTIDVEMEVEAIEGQTVTVVAQKSVVKVDVAASQTSVTDKEISSLPFANLSSVIGLSAGITSNLEIRGSGADQTMFMIDGMMLRDERTNQPISSIPLSAVQEVSTQTGGFTAEYNNVRGGIVNVVAKEGPVDHYTGTFTTRYSPPAAKHFGISVYDPNSYWLKPFLDDSVCWTGTSNGYWDYYTIRQYPQFDGWIAISNATLTDDDPTNDLTPEAAKRIFEWQYRKNGNIQKPDLTHDIGVGGPIPLVSQSLGNLRFYYSYRDEQDMYLMPLSTEGKNSYTHMAKVTSDVSRKTKISWIGLWSGLSATALSRTGGTSILETPYEIANIVDRVGFTAPWRIFTNDYFSETSRTEFSSSVNLSRIVNNNLFYEAQIRFFKRQYQTGPGRTRNTNKLYEIFPDYYLNEQPFGFSEGFSSSVDGGITLGGPISTSRDSSVIRTTAIKLNVTDQVNDNNQVKLGFNFNYDDFRLDYGSYNAVLPEGNLWTRFNRYPWRFNGFMSDKYETRGLVAVMGLSLDYSDPNGKWFKADPYDKTFNTLTDEELWKSDYTVDAKPVITISPRLAISHPLTISSKLYFNYGHYYEMPTAESLYRIRRSSTGSITFLGNPSLPLAKTVSYELGFDKAISETYLMHLTAYYKDVTDEQNWTQYVSADGKVNYDQLTNNLYEDIRGFEVELTKRSGEWMTGMINYEYRVVSSGYFAIGAYYQNPSEQRDYLRNNRYQSKPLPTPRMKGYINFFTPRTFGPKIFGQRILADWHANFIGRWTSGYWFTYNPNNYAGIQYNLQWRDYQNVDLKISKSIQFGPVVAKFYFDVFNLFNLKYFSNASFINSHDYDYYMQSLHLPKDVGDELGYGNISGNDRPGDYRKSGVDYVPIVSISDLDMVNDPYDRPLYYDRTSEIYYQYSNDTWVVADQNYVDQVLKDKAYIDMPNQTFYTFLNPRDIFFGINISYNF